CSWVHQYPRYVAAKKNTPVRFVCYCSEPQHTQWYRMQEDSEQLHGLEGNTSRYSVERTASYVNFTIFRIAYADNGIYVCDRRNLTEAKQVQACGTELQVLSLSSLQQVQNRNTLKDAIIIIQTILLVIFISVPLLLFLDKVSDGKESPEEDHTYEGLEVEQMATYEDITPFRDVKAKWTVGEHPGEE
ncbi:CD79B protein, partial [Eudromia elegans]|nr:CD79B protein [Eudromia elegans]